MTDTLQVSQGQRGPADHNVRDQIVQAANEHFSRYGYAKTTVSDLAREIGFSKAYIYKFFDSKQAIGEAICAACLTQVMDGVLKAMAQANTATERFRRLFLSLVELSAQLFFEERKLYEIAAHSVSEGWESSRAYETRIQELLTAILREGREGGEFERKTPLDEAARSIYLVMYPFINPLMLQYNLDRLPDAPREVASLVLRSLAP
ncbi:TetR/AcrR family transcriptional regulator [Achromobacter aloeverae]|uniref:TetR family transcriptional regulator n=1 Tax=Achromobacter aloeverae TaxID=1750518 RepID=A0A4Q1HDU2_9BURK|nr:TetR/AcrR family transcriptional regulator [Achromobacter aloeverae]RXN84468.1 TetR family transcriptional regulator [Achromobacter aloeverae]